MKLPCTVPATLHLTWHHKCSYAYYRNTLILLKMLISLISTSVSLHALIARFPLLIWMHHQTVGLSDHQCQVYIRGWCCSCYPICMLVQIGRCAPFAPAIGMNWKSLFMTTPWQVIDFYNNINNIWKFYTNIIILW